MLHFFWCMLASTYGLYQILGLPGKSLHQYRNMYKCTNDSCRRIYRNRSSLTRHLKFECGKQPTYSCMICQKRCALKSNLKQHMALVHKLVPRIWDYFPVKKFIYFLLLFHHSLLRLMFIWFHIFLNKNIHTISSDTIMNYSNSH